MGFFEHVADDLAGITTPEPGVCGPCKRERDRLVEMEAAETWQPGYVQPIWRCPECGSERVREGEETWL